MSTHKRKLFAVRSVRCSVFAIGFAIGSLLVSLSSFFAVSPPVWSLFTIFNTPTSIP